MSQRDTTDHQRSQAQTAAAEEPNLPDRLRTVNITNTTSTTSSGSYLRRQSLFGNDDRIILDIGSRVSKIGFSGEARPREIFYTLEGIYENGENILEHTGGLLWTPDMFRCRTDEERRLKTVTLKARLTTILREIFYKRLMIDPKQRKIFIIESVLMPDIVKHTLSEILFGNLLVPSICFVPSEVSCSLAIGRLTALILDVGYQEASILPVCFGRAMTHGHLLKSHRAGKRLARRLRSLLLHYATYVPSFSASSNDGPELRRVPDSLLTWKYLDQFISKALLVADGSMVDTKDVEFPEPARILLTDEVDNDAMMLALERRYNIKSRVKDLVMLVPPSTRPATKPPTQPSTLGPFSDSATSNTNRGSIIIPGWIRERAAEVLFEEGDEDDPSLVQMVLMTLIKLPVDLRVPMASSIYVVGGIAMLPGLAHRLRIELVKRLESCARYESPSSIALTTAMVGSVRLSPSTRRQSKDDIISSGEEEKEMQREQQRYGPISMLSDSIAVLNDHAPRLDKESLSQGGTAPSFSANIAGWIGGSLIGSLRVDTTNQQTREEWDLEREELAARGKSHKDAASARPGLSFGRGSFLGTVNGLDLGTYGPLSAGSRGSFTSPKGAASPRSSKVA